MTSSRTNRGRLKIFLGYAAGVGKTYQMLAEARPLRERSTDVVIAYFEPHGRRDTVAQTEGLETVPRRQVDYRGTRFEEMDTEAVLARHPEVALVDELAHTNVPGSPRPKRWEDVHVLLEAGSDVYTTMNVQHLESLNDQIWQSTGVRVRETVPDWVVGQADEVVMVDLAPRALLNRLERGVVYPADRARAALQNFFRESTLVALRELAMRQTAHTVESRQWHDEQAFTGADAPPSAPQDRLLFVIDAAPASAALIRRGRRVADYLGATCQAVYVCPAEGLGSLPESERDRVQRHLNFASGLHIEATVLQGDDVARTVVDFARDHGISQIFLTRQPETTVWSLFTEGLVQRLVNLAQDMQVTIVADRSVRREGKHT